MTTDELSRHALSFDLAADQFRERAAELQRLPPAFGGPVLGGWEADLMDECREQALAIARMMSAVADLARRLAA